MRAWNWDRLAAGSGLVFVVLLLLSAFITGSPPKVTDRSAKIVSFFTEHHRAGLIAGMLGGLAIIAGIWFFATLANRLREAGEPRLAAVAFGGGIMAGAIGMVATFLLTIMFYKVAKESPDLAKPMYIASSVGFTTIFFPLAATAWATGIAGWRSSIFPQWYAGLSMLGGLISVFAGGALASHGFYSPTGAYLWIAFIGFAVWTLMTSALLWRQAEGERAKATPVPA